MCRHVPKVPYGSYAPGDIIFMQSAQSIHVNVYTQLTEMCPSYINILLQNTCFCNTHCVWL
jgi:hypothetical protein